LFDRAGARLRRSEIDYVNIFDTFAQIVRLDLQTEGDSLSSSSLLRLTAI